MASGVRALTIPASQIERVCRGNRALVFGEQEETMDQGRQEQVGGLGPVGFQAGPL